MGKYRRKGRSGVRNNDGPKPFVCLVCANHYSAKRALVAHVRSKHIDVQPDVKAVPPGVVRYREQAGIPVRVHELDPAVPLLPIPGRDGGIDSFHHNHHAGEPVAEVKAERLQKERERRERQNERRRLARAAVRLALAKGVGGEEEEAAEETGVVADLRRKDDEQQERRNARRREKRAAERARRALTQAPSAPNTPTESSGGPFDDIHLPDMTPLSPVAPVLDAPYPPRAPGRVGRALQQEASASAQKRRRMHTARPTLESLASPSRVDDVAEAAWPMESLSLERESHQPSFLRALQSPPAPLPPVTPMGTEDDMVHPFDIDAAYAAFAFTPLCEPAVPTSDEEASEGAGRQRHLLDWTPMPFGTPAATFNMFGPNATPFLPSPACASYGGDGGLGAVVVPDEDAAAAFVLQTLGRPTRVYAYATVDGPSQ